MPAPFVIQLCGYRSNGKPNTSDKSQPFSVELGRAFFDAMGIPESAPAPDSVDVLMRTEIVDDLQQLFSSSAPHLTVNQERKLAEFEQFAHLGAIRALSEDPSGANIEKAISALETFSAQISDTSSTLLTSLIQDLRSEHTNSTVQRRLLLDTLGEESVLGLDVTVSRPSPYAGSALPHLAAGFSLKWSLRTDRAQDCRSQGAKMAALRRGRMPHFAAVTMEPRPYFLAILGGGSGELDCVYHLNLSALATAVDQVCTTKARRQSRDTFHRLCDQGRLRDYDDLRQYAATL